MMENIEIDIIIETMHGKWGYLQNNIFDFIINITIYFI